MGTRVTPLALLFFCAMLAVGTVPHAAFAQAPINPNRPVPAPRYPICDSLQDRSGALSCTGNPYRPQTRAECGWNCPEDRPDIYDRLHEGTLRLFCGDGEGRGCVDAYFEREHETLGRRCIYRVVLSYDSVPHEERRYAVLVTDLPHQGRIDLIRTTHQAHARFGRRYERQVRDTVRFNAPPPPGYYQAQWRDPCRH